MKTEIREAMENRARRARRAGLLLPVADWFGPAETEFRATRPELVGTGLHAPYGEEPRLVVLYRYASCPEDVEESRVDAEELGIPRWTAGHVLSHAHELALEWLADRERWTALRSMGLAARWINEGAAEARERGAA